MKRKFISKPSSKSSSKLLGKPLHAAALLLVFSMLFCSVVIPLSANSAAVNNSASQSCNTTSTVQQKVALKADDPGVKDSKFIEYIGVDAFEAAGHVNRVTELEELGTYVFDNMDGTRTVYYMGEDVKFVDTDGSVREKDITLTQKTGGYSIGQSNFELFIPASPSSGIDVGYSGYSVKLIPEGLRAATVTERMDNSVVYRGAYGTKAHLRYTPVLSGVKEDIVLGGYVSNAVYTFTLETDGLFVYSNKNGYYLAENAQSKAVFHLGNVIVHDAVGRPDEGGMTVEAIEAGEKYRITIWAEDEFLSDSETVYPVIIDPSITVTENTEGTAIEDAVIFQGKPDRNYGDYTYNTVGTPSESYGKGRTVVRLTGLINSTEYLGIHADDVVSVYFYAKEATGNASRFINLYPMTTNTTWTESTITWNNAGGYATAENYGANLVNGREAAFDITGLVQEWKQEDDGEYEAQAGFIMISSDETANKSFYSSEHSNTGARPRVVMTYDAVLTLDKYTLVLEEGESATITATTVPADGGTVYWNKTGSSAATISSDGKVCTVNAVSAGSVIVYASMTDSDGVPHQVECTIQVVTLHEGIYIMRSRGSEKFVDITNNTTTSGSIIYQNSFEGDDYQRWEVTHVDDRYYTIRSMASSIIQPYYLAVANDSGAAGANIVLKNGTISDGMLWEFQRVTVADSERIYYKLIAKCANSDDYVLVSPGENIGISLKQDDVNDIVQYHDEWRMMRILPTNGYEPDYQPELWDSTARGCNCYGYAINNQLWVYDSEEDDEDITVDRNIVWMQQEPGELYTRIIDEYQGLYVVECTAEAILDAVRRDFVVYSQMYGETFTIEPIGRYELCPAGSYKVALVIEGYSGYHWLRQDSDGLWSNKYPGAGAKRMYLNNYIIDPYYIVIDHADIVFFGYFAITPINCIYTGNGSEEVYAYDDNEMRDIIPLFIGDICSNDKITERS